MKIGDYFKIGKNIHQVVSIFGDSYRAEDGYDYREGIKHIPTFNIRDVVSYNFNPKRIFEVENIIEGIYYFTDGSTAPITVNFTVVKEHSL